MTSRAKTYISKYYIFVAVFGKVRADCLDGFSNHCIFVSPCYCSYIGRFLRRAFFDMSLALEIGVENVKGIQSYKYE